MFAAEQRLVTLNVDYHVESGVGGSLRDFGDTIRAGGVIGPGQLDRSADGSTHIGDGLGVRGDHGGIQSPHVANATPHPLDQRSPEKRIEGFVGESGRRQPRRDDAQNAAGSTVAGSGVRTGCVCKIHAM